MTAPAFLHPAAAAFTNTRLPRTAIAPTGWSPPCHLRPRRVRCTDTGGLSRNFF